MPVDDYAHHDELVREAMTLLSPIVRRPRFGRRDVEVEVSRIKQAADILDRARSIYPNNWATWWSLGAAWRSVGIWADAYSCFAEAYKINPANVDVARELSIACLQTGRLEEGKELARHAMDIRPNDAGLKANYALALYANGEIELAKGEVEKCLLMDPADRTTKMVAEKIGLDVGG